MGVQSSDDSRISELERTLRRVQAELDELKKARSDGAAEAAEDAEDAEDARSSDDSSVGPGPRRRARYRLSPESDDDEGPTSNGAKVKIEKANIERLARANAAAKTAAGQKRKRAASVRLDVSGLAASLPDINAREDEPERLVVTMPVCFDAAHSEDEETSRPTKKTKRQARPTPKFKTTPQRSLPVPEWTKSTQPPASPTPATAFRLPDANLMSRFQASKAGAKQNSADKQKSTATKPSSDHQSASQKDTPANNQPPSPARKADKKKSKFAVQSFFPFKFIVHYNNATKTTNVSDFWYRLSELVLTWESRAGAFWEWELAKPSRKKGMRVCVSSALAKKRTRWRRDDAGFFVCQECASKALPCFTWVRLEGEQGEDEEAEGEFWCLPVHKEDRYIPEIVKGEEIRIWTNEASEDENGDESGYGGFGDDMAFEGSESEQEDDDDEDEDEEDSEEGADYEHWAPRAGEQKLEQSQIKTVGKRQR